MVHLRAEQLGHRYGRRILFRRLDLELRGGTILAVTGANGSGKSTLIRILAGLLTPSRGKVVLTLDGRSVPVDERPFHVGLVAPYLNVYDAFSARENLAFVARARRLPDARRRIDAVLERVQLGGRGDDLVATYSSGMKQRVRFAVALLASPSLLLLDEPTSNLDAPGRAMVAQLIDEARREGRAVVVATNDPDEAARCDRRLCVEDYG
ncbi:MAG: ABC transporter ATP-binding protein [Bacteroidetes bacterium]|nr:MAG: ABC transporter ATP-binding protein [Bacteroidota bacterium]